MNMHDLIWIFKRNTSCYFLLLLLGQLPLRFWWWWSLTKLQPFGQNMMLAFMLITCKHGDKLKKSWFLHLWLRVLDWMLISVQIYWVWMRTEFCPVSLSYYRVIILKAGYHNPNRTIKNPLSLMVLIPSEGCRIRPLLWFTFRSYYTAT